MSKKTDIIVVGSGLAGLMAACAAASSGCRVRLFCEGMGSLAISPGCIDLLGYDSAGQAITNPWEAIQTLPDDHPYTLLGKETVKTALDDLIKRAGNHGLEMKSSVADNGEPRNTCLPTIMGTLKPTWLAPGEFDAEALARAQRLLVVSVSGFRDCRPRLIIGQLRRYKGWADKTYDPVILPAPFDEHGRSVSALDLARACDRDAGWMVQALKNKGKDYDFALLPPMLGVRCDSEIRKIARETLGCPFAELLTIPPGVTGLRLRDALIKETRKLGVEFYENASVVKTECKDGFCESLTVASSGREMTHSAKAVVVATGGILSGGVILEQGKAREALFNLEIPVPENVDKWSEAEIFERHLVSRLGVRVNGEMRPVDENGVPCLRNVFFAGRTIGGYDYAAEKSGHGVAAATGWQAGRMAASPTNK